MVEDVACTECGHTRPAKTMDGTLQPFKEECPKCETMDFKLAPKDSRIPSQESDTE